MFSSLEELMYKILFTFFSSDNITFSFPLIIKPNDGGSTIGLYFVDNEKDFNDLILSAFNESNSLMIEKYLKADINKDVENMGFSETIVTKADELYTQVTKGQIYRGNSRKAIVFACIFHAYKMSGKHQTPDNLVKLFGLSRKNGLHGLKIVAVNAPKDSKIHTTVITPVHLVHDIMSKFRATPDQKKEVIHLYARIKNRSSKLNRSRPQSVAAAITYYWIKKKKLDINLKDFAKKVDLSELTINKNAKEVALVLGTPDII